MYELILIESQTCHRPIPTSEMHYFPSRFISRDILLRFVSCHSSHSRCARALEIYARYTLYCDCNGLVYKSFGEMLPRKLIFLHSPLGWYVPGGDIVLQMYGLQSELDIVGDVTL